MRTEDTIEVYVDEVRRQLSSGHAREHAYRPALKNLLSSFEDALAVNDPKRSEHGNPDFIILKESNQSIVRGYAEAKDITVDLDKTAQSEQLRRYAGYNKLFLTNYLDFRFYRNGEEYERISIGQLQDQSIEFYTAEFSRLDNELKAFLELPPEPIKSGKSLALIMGAKGQRIRDSVAHFLEIGSDKNQELEKIYAMMKELLVHDLTKEKFADMYAQTLVYGLFAARYADSTPDNFTRSKARDLVPKSNPFLRKFFDHIAGSDFDTRLAHIVDELCEVFAVSDVHLLVKKHLRMFEVDNEKDPVIHFYEDFLKEYDPAERKRMGAYYTPIPVVRFIVRQVDDILKREFGLSKGLADTSKITQEIDHGQQLQVRNQKTGRLEKTSVEKREFHKIQVLDPAVGTATFLNETVWHIHKTFKGQEGRWPAYVEADLLPRLSGFELMMAPYTIAHLKLSMTLQETGVKDLDQRVGVYLTNTLEEEIPRQQDLFSIGLAAVVTEESLKASEIKHDRPIMVVMGNPPYSVSSNNKSPFIDRLISEYKINLKETNIQPLSDDYIKFIRFSEYMVDKNGEGIMAMITNNSYLDGLIHRQMRKHLLDTFDKIYILDLHGNAKKKETAPDGSKDENVFDIQQGVAIIIAIKSKQIPSNTRQEIYHAELYGSRKQKFIDLNGQPQWQIITPMASNYFYVPDNSTPEEREKYEKLVSIADLFIVKGSGIKFRKDNLLIKSNWTKQIAEQMVQDVINLDNQQIINKYNLKETTDWQLDNQRENFTDAKKEDFIKIQYRPFDYRWTYYPLDRINKIIPRGDSRHSLMKQFISKSNIGLILSRQFGAGKYFIVMVSGDPIEISSQPFAPYNIMPLYNYHDDGTRTPNFNPNILNKFTKNIVGDCEPEDIFDYIYAVLYSPTYREKYKEFLKIDFPRVPVPENDTELKRLANLGKQLRELHLMKAPYTDNYITTFPEQGSDEVGNTKYDNDKVWINNTQYFGNVPEVAWSFYIGGYQPAQKWLKDRKGRKLTSEDLMQYQKIIKVLGETDRIMKQIDAIGFMDNL